MSKGAKFYEGQFARQKEVTADLHRQLVTANHRILHLESKLLGVDFSLKNWYRQKIRKQKTTDILNFKS